MKVRLPLLGARVAEVGFSTKLGWELRETITRIHFDTAICSTTGVGGLEGSVESRGVEGEEFIEAVTDALEGAACSIGNAVGPTDLAASGIVLTGDLLWNFDNTIKDVTDSTAEFTSRIVFRSWRDLNVCLCRHGKA